MSKKYSLYEYSRDDQVISNLMALNGADPVSVYKKRTSTTASLGASMLCTGAIFTFIFPILGLGMVIAGVVILILRFSTIRKIRKEISKQQKNAAQNERAALKEEVRREMLKEEIRAEIEAEKSTRKSVKKKNP